MTTSVEAAPNWTTQCRCGDALVQVDPEMVQGPYAVHRTIKDMRPVGPGYTITHRPSGYAVWHVREFSAAIAVAKWLDENVTLPPSYDAVWNWKQNLTPNERTRLVGGMSAIAPREWVTA